MNTETIIYENYTFKVESNINQIKINITDNDLIESYECTIKENELNVTSTKKFYSMIIRALNKEKFYTFQINNQESKLVCNFYYKTDMIELEEKIILNKMLIMNEKQELILLRERVKSLELMLTPIFGRHVTTYEPMRFDLDSITLDFRPFNNDYNKSNHDEYILFTNTLSEFNKFIYVKKIIFDTFTSPVYYLTKPFKDTIYEYTLCYRYNEQYPLIFDRPLMIRLPTVTEIEVYVNDKEYNPSFYSLPNLEKISIINNDKLSPMILHSFNLFDPMHYLCNIGSKKLNHLIIKNIFVINEEKSRQYAKQKNIKLEIIFDY